MFLRTDTHWTPAGAEVVAHQLAQAIADKTPLSGQPQRFVTQTQETVKHQGDLRRFLPLDPLFENLMPAPEPCKNARPTPPGNRPAPQTTCSPTTKCP